MTPQEISDHKRTWMINGKYNVDIHSDLRWESRDWLKTHIPRQAFHITEYTSVYQDTIYFEQFESLRLFYEWYEGRFKKAPKWEELGLTP